MCGPAAAVIGTAGALISGFNAYSQNQAAGKAAEYQGDIYRQNAVIAQNNAVNERQAGINEARKIQLQTASNIATQKTAMAASGVDVTAGSALDLLDTTKYFGEMDALTTKTNAGYRASAYEAQGQDFLTQAGVSSEVAKNYRNSSLLSGLGTSMTGLGQVNSSWYSWNKGTNALTPKATAPKLQS